MVTRQKGVGWRVDVRPQSLVGHSTNCDITLRDRGSHWEILSRRITWSDLGLKDPCLYETWPMKVKDKGRKRSVVGLRREEKVRVGE